MNGHTKRLLTELLRNWGEDDRVVANFELYGDATVRFGEDVTAYIQKRYGSEKLSVSLNWRSSSAHASIPEARQFAFELGQATSFAGLVEAVLDCAGELG